MRKAPQPLRLRGADRAFMVWITRLWPHLLGLSRVVRPDTILRWHRAGFRTYWHWKSRGQPGRPPLIALVRRDPASDGRIVGTADCGGLPVGRGADLLGPRQ
jgi:hypothetical protein